MEYIKFLGIGIVGGTAAGLLGIGGGTIIIPLLLYFTGMDIKAATAVSMMHITFASISGTIFNYFQKTIIFKYSIYFGLSGMAFSFLGSYLTKYIPDPALKIIYICALTVSFILLILRFRISREKAWDLSPRRRDLYKIIPVGAVAGFIAGLLGIGGGFLFVPVLMFFFGMPINIATGTSLGAIIFISVPGLAGKFLSVDFNVLFGLVVGTGGIAGVRIGTYLKRKTSPRVTRLLFILFFIIVFTRVVIDIISYFMKMS